MKVRIVPGTADEKLGNMRRRVPFRLSGAIRVALHIYHGQIVRRTPRGASGVLAEAYQMEMRGTPKHPKGVLANAVLYHDVREDGRRAGRMPPVAALIPWVGSKLGIPAGPERDSVAFLVARKIGRVGYEGSHHVEEGSKEARRQLRPIMTKMGYEIVKDIR